ncbi:GSCFA domain-containing protein [Robiginitalea marina]|uniref:GSCFA domain-containing protein n=1 Tax=Robiginitalea marina TaxID=2954105 RepID=A0ABT1B281_9FLAO|nr:GSCFA domain-containing protein [Robiginitalea marina]MCO5725955.1 GSCFA domain-containing protein [Robiginitalea marina]
MKWRTELTIPQGYPKIGYGDFVFLLGSCFASHLSQKLQYFQLPYLGNPFGVLYHPAPIENLLSRAVAERPFREEDLFEHEGLWRNLETHSQVAGPGREDTLQTMNAALKDTRRALERATHVVLTLGTAHAFRHRETGRLVANCHKLPADHFTRELSPVQELQDSLGRILEVLRAFRADLTVLLTVSPVRHIRDGLVENQRSKAHLLAAAHHQVDQGLAGYFPAYEIMMDELRDYRFYEADLIHPNTQAVDFIWEQFAACWVEEAARPLMERVGEVRRQAEHRPLQADSPAYREFRRSLEARARALMDEYPQIRFDL